MEPEAEAAETYYKRFGTSLEVTVNRAAKMFGTYGAAVHSFMATYNLGMPDGRRDAQSCLRRLRQIAD